jgi:hypothetical protein
MNTKQEAVNEINTFLSNIPEGQGPVEYVLMVATRSDDGVQVDGCVSSSASSRLAFVESIVQDAVQTSEKLSSKLARATYLALIAQACCNARGEDEE